jgi:hypothetical protein
MLQYSVIFHWAIMPSHFSEISHSSLLQCSAIPRCYNTQPFLIIVNSTILLQCSELSHFYDFVIHFATVNSAIFATVLSPFNELSHLLQCWVILWFIGYFAIKFDNIASPMEILTKLFLAYRGISSPLNLGQYFFWNWKPN